MAYSPNLVYLKWTFDYVGGTGQEDIQEFGLWCYVEPNTPPPDWPALLQAIATGARDSWNSAWGGVVSWFSNAVTAKMVTAYQMDNTLHTVSTAVALFSGGDAWAGTGSNGLPPQDALVVSTYRDDPTTYHTNRASRRGRFYLPTMDAGMLSSQGVVSGTHQAGILGQAAAFISDLYALSLPSGATLWPSVLSRKLVEEGGITYVGVGVIMDTQRRRRNKLVENYAYATT